MSGRQEYSSLVDRILVSLRAKREKGEADPRVSLEEVARGLGSEEGGSVYQKYVLPSSLVEGGFLREIESNPKVGYDRTGKTFGLRRKYRDINDLEKRLYSEKVGVIEDQHLYDDIDRDVLEAVKRNGLVRSIIIQEKKTKPATTYLFSKNIDDEVEKLRYDERTPDLLREHWRKIDKDELERKIHTKKSVQTLIARDAEHRPLRSTKRRRKVKDEDNVQRWHNQHILPRIEEALKMLNKRAPETSKKGGFSSSSTSQRRPTSN